MPVKEKDYRNKLIYERYKKNKHGYKRLAKEFDLDWRTVYHIVRRYKKREGL